jgi:ADP-ribose pyrophosphatase YjhB (NUDIX family)
MAQQRGPTGPIDRCEFKVLVAEYGDGTVERLDLDIDESLYLLRLEKAADRRAEVVFAIQGLGGGVLVHRKFFWEDGLYRLPTGGINPREWVVAALTRELREETNLVAEGIRFFGAQDCHLHYDGQVCRFVSYVFHITRAVGRLVPEEREGIAEFREISTEQLADLATRLRHLNPPYSGWGRWRAAAHDLVYRRLTDDERHSPNTTR